MLYTDYSPHLLYLLYFSNIDSLYHPVHNQENNRDPQIRLNRKPILGHVPNRSPI